MDTASSVSKMFSALNSQQDLRDSLSNTLLSTGLGLLQNGKYKEAAAALKQSTVMKPDQTEAYNYMASAYLQLGRRKEAVEAYTISLKLDRSQSDIHVKLANIHIEDKNYSAAEKALKAGINADSTDSLMPYTLGQMYLLIDRPVDAEAQFANVLRQSPQDGNAYYAMGMALSKQGKLEEAETFLQRATELKKDFAPALYELGAVHVALGDFEEAAQQLEALKKIETSQAAALAGDLEEVMRRPKMSLVAGKGTFDTNLGTVSLLALSTEMIKPGVMKEFSVQFTFDAKMDSDSVTNVTNWKLSKPRQGGTAGLYDNGLYRPSDTPVASMPSRVLYDPSSSTATVYFQLVQSSDPANMRTIDPEHLTFSFLGKDISGKTMDTSADEYNGFVKNAF